MPPGHRAAWGRNARAEPHVSHVDQGSLAAPRGSPPCTVVLAWVARAAVASQERETTEVVPRIWAGLWGEAATWSLGGAPAAHPAPLVAHRLLAGPPWPARCASQPSSPRRRLAPQPSPRLAARGPRLLSAAPSPPSSAVVPHTRSLLRRHLGLQPLPARSTPRRSTSWVPTAFGRHVELSPVTTWRRGALPEEALEGE